MNAKLKWLWRLSILLFVPGVGSQAAQTWTDALSKMRLVRPARELNSTNCVDLMLRSFRSNDVVKALIFMPGATDEFYLFHRAKARLRHSSSTLLEAVAALTNQTLIRADFRPPMLLLHSDEDPLEADFTLRDPDSREFFHQRKFPHLLFNDRDWSTVQPSLKWPLHAEVRPWANSQGAWHFYRHSFAAWDLDGWEVLEAIALAGKSRFSVQGKTVVFEPDPRVLAAPHAGAAPPRNGGG